MPSQLSLLSAGKFEALHASVQKEIYREYYDFVYGIAYYRVLDHASTEDIIQDSFLKVILHAPPIEDDGKLKSWIRTVVKNTVYSFLRKKRRRSCEIDVAGTTLSEYDFTPHAASVEQEIEFKHWVETIERALRELKPDQRTLLEMRWKGELSYKEIAGLLNTSEETIKHRLHRARAAMRKRLDMLWGEPSGGIG